MWSSAVVSESSWCPLKAHTVCAIIIRQTPEISMDLDADAAGRGPRSNPASDGGVGLLEEVRLVDGALRVVEDDGRGVEVLGVHAGDAEREGEREDESCEDEEPHVVGRELLCLRLPSVLYRMFADSSLCRNGCTKELLMMIRVLYERVLMRRRHLR